MKIFQSKWLQKNLKSPPKINVLLKVLQVHQRKLGEQNSSAGVNQDNHTTAIAALPIQPTCILILYLQTYAAEKKHQNTVLCTKDTVSKKSVFIFAQNTVSPQHQFTI